MTLLTFTLANHRSGTWEWTIQKLMISNLAVTLLIPGKKIMYLLQEDSSWKVQRETGVSYSINSGNRWGHGRWYLWTMTINLNQVSQGIVAANGRITRARWENGAEEIPQERENDDNRNSEEAFPICQLVAMNPMGVEVTSALMMLPEPNCSFLKLWNNCKKNYRKQKS